MSTTQATLTKKINKNANHRPAAAFPVISETADMLLFDLHCMKSVRIRSYQKNSKYGHFSGSIT